MNRSVAPLRAVSLLLLFGLGSRAAAQESAIAGTVRWEGRPIAQALVEVMLDDSVLVRARSDNAGHFRLRVPPGDYTVRIRLAGFAEWRNQGVGVAAADSAVVLADLEYRAVPLTQVVVAVSRRAETAIDAPAAISVVGEREVRERSAVSPLDHTVGLPGVDVAVQGLQARQVVARGFNGVFGTSLRLLSDFRDISIPSLRGNLSTFVTAASEDLDRVEVVRGPASALYGPNAADGVVHFVTKSPFDSPGTSLSVTGGGQSVFETSARVARVVNNRFAFRASGTYLRGREWDAPPDPTELTLRDADIERLNAEARADVRLSPTATAVVSLGTTVAMNNVEYTTIGATQVKDWRTDFAQVRFSDGRFSAQAYVNLNDAGDSFLLQSNQTVRDRSTYLVSQVQHAFEFAGRSLVTYGVDMQRTNPVTYGTIDGRNENDDASLELGAYLQADTPLSERWRLLTAARADRHDRMGGTVWSPRVALVFSPAVGQALRLTYNRAFSTPTSPELFVDLVAGPLGPLPYTLRVLGVPKDGLSFRAMCGAGQCMTSPFAGPSPMPLDATALWPAVVQFMQALNVDLSGLPAPTSAEVGTVLRALDLTSGAFRDYAGPVHDIAPLEPTITSSVEFGYKGLVGDRLRLEANVYHTRRLNFISPVAVVTPNAFLSTSDLTTWLSRFMPPGDAAALAAGIGGVSGSAEAPGIPLGTVGPDGPLGGTDIILTYSNFGDARLWGADVSFEYAASPTLSLAGGYSHTSRVYFPAKRSGESDLSMNAPRNKAVVSATFRDPGSDFSATVRGRHVGAFRMLNGVWSGDVHDFTVFDIETGVTLPAAPSARVTLTVQNVANDRHAEFYGAPVLGRLALVRLQYRF